MFSPYFHTINFNSQALYKLLISKKSEYIAIAKSA